MPFMRIDHIGVAVADLEKAAATFERLLGLKVAAREEVEDQQLIAALVPTADARFELMQPTDPGSVVGRFLERRGEGIHHICFEVGNIDEEIETLKGRDVQLIQGAPRQGFVGLVEFIHPRSAAGVLVEIAQVSLRTPTSTETRIQAINIATKDLDTAADLWKRNFQMAEKGPPNIDTGAVDASEGGTRSVTLDPPGASGPALIKFLQPDTPGVPLADFIEKRGEGIYSLALRAPGAPGIIPPEDLLGLRIALLQA